MRKFLHKPYPFVPIQKIWLNALVIGCFVFLFLFVFRPFGLNNLSTARLWSITLGYGLISFLVTLIIAGSFRLLISNFFNEDSWKVYKEIFSILTILLGIGTANYFYTVWLNFTAFTLAGFFGMLLSTLAIGSLIVIASVAFSVNRALKKNLKEAKLMSTHLSEKVVSGETDNEDPLLLKSEIESQNLTVAPSKLIYLTSNGNYIECVFLDEAGNPNTAKIRNRIKIIEKELSPYPSFFRCHRAFIVNIDFIESVEGNTKGFNLQLLHTDAIIPVARSKSAKLKAILD